MLKLKVLKAIDKIEKFFSSKKFLVVCFIVACLVTIFAGDVSQEYQMKVIIAGILVFTALICVILVFAKNLISTLLPFLLTSMFVLKCYDSFNTFIKFWWLAIPVVIAFVFHLIRYYRCVKIGKTFWAVLAVAVAMTLGGIGSLSPAEYFSGVSMFYTIGLGFGMVLVYMIFNIYISDDGERSLKRRLSTIMFFVCAFACFMILEHYAVNIKTVLEFPRVFNNIQWRNNLSTFIMISMPFVFYVSMRRPWATCVGVLSVFCLFLTGSRGGSMFGAIEFILCIITILIMDKKHRIVNIIIFAVTAVLVAVFFSKLLEFFWGIIDRTTNGDMQRWALIEKAVEDFKSKPILGRGLAYSGNTDVYNPKKFALYWYHSAPFQIIGSLGIVGVLGYAFQIGTYLKILWEGKTKFDFTIFISFVGLWMMSCVNPGVFCPVPYALLVTLFFTVSEKCTQTRKKEEQIEVEKEQTA